MDPEAGFESAHRGTLAFARLLGTARGATVHEVGGVHATVAPGCPDRSVVNSVGYDTAEALEAALPEVAETYEQAGIDAWTVWVPKQDRQAADLLAGAGHLLDASPLAMICPLEDAVPPGDVPEDWTGEADVAVLGPLNDRAYGYEGSFTRALEGMPGDSVMTWVANVDGEPVTCLATIDQGADRHVILVATLPEFRGRGLASGLLARAIADAREHGMGTTSLIATKLGAPVYERLGYRSVGVIEMWERRRPRD